MHTPYTCDVPVYKEYLLHLWRPLPTAFKAEEGVRTEAERPLAKRSTYCKMDAQKKWNIIASILRITSEASLHLRRPCVQEVTLLSKETSTGFTPDVPIHKRSV